MKHSKSTTKVSVKSRTPARESKRRVQVTLTKTLADRFTAAAEKRGINENVVLLLLIEEECQKQESTH